MEKIRINRYLLYIYTLNSFSLKLISRQEYLQAQIDVDELCQSSEVDSTSEIMDHNLR